MLLPFPTRQLPHPRPLAFALAILGPLAISLTLPAQTPKPLPVGTPTSWAQAAAANELPIVNDEGEFPLRYRIRKIDAKADVTREIIESKEGGVSRIIARNGQPLTNDENTDELNRLNAILADPSDFLKHRKRDNATRNYSMDLVRLMPKAMIFTYAPDQPQPANAHTPQIVLDFHSDPAWKPPTTVSELLTGLEGRMWIDAQSRRLTRIEGRVVRPVNLGFGMLIHIYPGGTVVFEQSNVGNNRWVYSHLDENLSVRELMIKTQNVKATQTSSDYRLLPAPIGYQEAIRTLISIPIPLR